MPSKMTRTVFSFWTSCSEATFDVSRRRIYIYPISRFLSVHLERKGALAEDVVRFWVAELASALAYLHKRRIVHRWVILPQEYNVWLTSYWHSDLKPDNILLDSQGHVHITDFNVAIHYSERRMHTSVAGSMAYMAPEVIGRKGYTWCIDWWSLGVTTYELLFNRRPFEGRTTEKMTNSILKDSLKFPDDASQRCTPSAIEFVQGVRFNVFIIDGILLILGAAPRAQC